MNVIDIGPGVRRYPENPGICTRDHLIEVGAEYDYHETMPTTNIRVRVVEDRSDEGRVELLLEALGGDAPPGDTFAYSMVHGRFAFGGMARLFPAGEYVRVD